MEMVQSRRRFLATLGLGWAAGLIVPARELLRARP
jgi:hypothetical protein